MPPAARTMPRNMAPKTRCWTRQNRYQYASPTYPAGSNTVVRRICEAAVGLGVDLELQRQTSRYLHRGREAQDPVGLEPFRPPEIDRIADAQVNRITPATT
jgi:hypothetical protein